MTKRVFIVQNPHRWNDREKQFAPVFDFSSAQDYGELHFLLSPTASPFNPPSVIAELKEKLAGFSDDDHLLLVGNPALIGFASIVAADFNDGRVKMLQWSGKDHRYIPIEASDLFTYTEA